MASTSMNRDVGRDLEAQRILQPLGAASLSYHLPRYDPCHQKVLITLGKDLDLGGSGNHPSGR